MKKILRWFMVILCLAVLLSYLYTKRINVMNVMNNIRGTQYGTVLQDLTDTPVIETTQHECSGILSGLIGKINISLQVPTPSEMHNISLSLSPGGEYLPGHCHNPHHVAIIVPYRNRTEQLPVFLAHIHPFLMRQNIHYKIYIVNQADSNEFNRAMLMNIGFKEALGDYNWTCFIFHDVDHLPEDDRNLYSCPDQIRHMAVSMDKWNYKLMDKRYFGGVVAIRREHFEKINGLSNKFWGWGGEDDDMYTRVVSNGLNITRYTKEIGRYTTIKHEHANGGIGIQTNPRTLQLLKTVNGSFRTDGLSSVSYNILSSVSEPLFTNITVVLHRTVPK